MVEKKKGLRIVLDTNVLLSAVLFGGRLARMVDLWENGRITPVFSSETFNEFRRALEYPKFGLTQDERKALIDHCIGYFAVVDVVAKIQGVCRDPFDDKFLACALSASARYLVSGDNDLLSIGHYKNIRIISSAELLRIYA
jgi:uncharacterized protein